MLTLYFSPGACSMAARVVLQESGEEYKSQRVNFADAEQHSEAYLKINPQGRVPALILNDGEPLAENTAIPPYLGKRFGFTLPTPVYILRFKRGAARRLTDTSGRSTASSRGDIG